MSHDKNPKHRWLDEALALPCDSIVTREQATEYLQPLLKRCNAKSKKTFWQWLRIQLARHEENANHLAWMQESRCPLEVTRVNGFRYVINGDTALIEVGDIEHPCVWRVPVPRLQWALSMFPVAVKQLPALESEQTKQIRKLKRQFKCKMPYLTPDQRDAFVRDLEELEAMSPKDTSAPRYVLIKYQDGRETPVHRLYLDAGPNDEVDAVDGDFLNFGTTKVRVTVEPVPVKGLAIAKGNQPPSWTHECEVPNLQIVNSEEAQRDFEANHLQIRLTAHGDIKEASPKILPNAFWTDAKFQPLTPSEIEVLGRGNVELDSDRPKDVSKLCREQSDSAKEFNSKQWRTIQTKK